MIPIHPQTMISHLRALQTAAAIPRPQHAEPHFTPLPKVPINIES